MLSFHDVSFNYPGMAPIFAGLSLRVTEGATTAIMGPSGSGKTTLLKLACGLLVPTSGRVCVQEQAVQLGRVRGVVFHEDTLLPWLTVAENVMFAAMDSAAVWEDARTLLLKFGLGGALEAYPFQLSQGMRKRAELARALLSDNRVLLLDEPFVSLDRRSRGEFWELWRNSNAIKSRTKIIVTHDREEVLAIADDVIVLDSGRPVVVRPARVASSIMEAVDTLLEGASIDPKETPVKSGDQKRQ